MNEVETTIQSLHPALPAGSVALVTGAARRLGAAMAVALARAGCDVVLHCHRSVEAAGETAAAVEAAGRRAWLLQADLADGDALGGLIARANALAAEGGAPGGVNILVNNASIFEEDGIGDCTAEAIAKNMALHAVAPLTLARDMAAALAPGRPGRVVNLLDSRVHDVDPLHASYHLSKRTLLDITRLLAVELAPTTTVNAIAPGLILPPPGLDEAAGAAYLERLSPTCPLHRCGSGDDVAAAALYLASAEFITGQVIYVDGGRHLKGAVHH